MSLTRLDADIFSHRNQELIENNEKHILVYRVTQEPLSWQDCFNFFLFLLPSYTEILPAETVEVVTTEDPETDEPSCSLAQSLPAENLARPSVPGSREAKSR